MTRQALFQQFTKYINSLDIEEYIMEKFAKAVRSNRLDISTESDANSPLPAIIAHAALCMLAEEIKPNNAGSRMFSKTLQRVLQPRKLRSKSLISRGWVAAKKSLSLLKIIYVNTIK